MGHVSTPAPLREGLDRARSWMGDPSLRLSDKLTPGQRYTYAIALLVVVTVLVGGAPDGRGGNGGSASASATAEPLGSSQLRSRPASPDEVPLGSPVLSLPPTVFTTTAPAANEPEARNVVAAGPLRIVRAGFASASAGTPLATVGVPDGSVAVSRSAGSAHDVIYLELSGRGDSLELTVDPNGANSFDSLAGLQLCVVHDRGWTVGHGDVTLDEAPKVDCSAPVDGERSTDGGRWTFDTHGINTSTVGGVAIVPSESAPAPQFQIVVRGTSDT